MKKTYTILIPNATSPRNVGNQAIMSVLVSLLRKSYPGCRILMHGFDPHLQKDPVDSVRHSLYSWAVFANTNVFVRMYRMLMVFLGIAGFSHIPLELSKILREYKEADLVVLEAGGYLTTRPGLSQTLNFFMQLLPIYVSIKLNKKIIQSPFSIGPFAYSWQEYLVGRLFKHVDRVFTREDISYELLERNGVYAEKSADLVFFSSDVKKIDRNKKRAIGIVMRKWGVEEIVAKAIAIFAKKHQYSVVPIVQCHATEYKDFDEESVLQVGQLLKREGIYVHPVQSIATPAQGRNVYASLSMMVSFRMHAALFAFMEGVPAIVITDEIKGKGIFGQLGVPELALSLKDIDGISNALEYIVKNKRTIQRTVTSSLQAIRKVKPNFTKRPTVTVAVSAYNEENNITPFLKSVLSQREDGFALSRIEVISDGSTDRTAQKVREYKSKKIHVREFKQRRGKSLRLNVIYKNLQTDYLIQTDADVLFATPFVIRDMVRALERNPKIGLCAGNPIPLPAETCIERGINRTAAAYQRLRFLVRSAHNPFSADGRLLGLSKSFARTITIPSDMIANDRYVYYVCKTSGLDYAFVPQAIVYFRSPQTLEDHIRQNTRFVAAPIRMKRYFPSSLVTREEFIPWYLRIFVFLEQWIKDPLAMTVVVAVNRYCTIRARAIEKRLTAEWDMALTTKTL